jgi:hypothetical protein|tara:strand:- start:209 stop:331 length:123 start_codon:yes stop_codon:yes gene_type:complete
MIVTDGSSISTTYDEYYDILKVEYFKDGGIQITYVEKKDV